MSINLSHTHFILSGERDLYFSKHKAAGLGILNFSNRSNGPLSNRINLLIQTMGKLQNIKNKDKASETFRKSR